MAISFWGGEPPPIAHTLGGQPSFQTGCAADACDRGFDPDHGCVGPVWDDFEATWVPVQNYFRAGHPDPRPPLGCVDENGNPAMTVAYGGGFQINFHASWLAFDAYVCDQILLRARLLVEYSETLRAQGRVAWVEARRVGTMMSRYALRVIAWWGRYMIHELGHSYYACPSVGACPSGIHCEWDCCFDLGSLSWLCGVQGELGLPFYQYVTADPQNRPDWSGRVYDIDASHDSALVNCGRTNSFGDLQLRWDLTNPSLPGAGSSLTCGGYVGSSCSG